MFKFLVLSLVLFHGIYEISGENDNGASDTEAPRISSISLQKKDGVEKSFGSDPSGHYNFHAANIVFSLNGPSAWRQVLGLSNSLINTDKEFGSGYFATTGIGAHKLHTRKLSWNKARKICTEEGGHLAVIRTDSEEKIILQMMVQDLVEDAWIGLHDEFEEGDWVSVLDEPLGQTGWAKWSKKISPNPDNYQGKQHCARLIKNGGGMDDDNCELAKSFVCKISNP